MVKLQALFTGRANGSTSPVCQRRAPGYNERMENELPKRITIDQLAGMMANGFAEMRDQFAALENHLGDVDQHVGNLDARVVGVEKGLKGLSYKVDQLDQKLDQHHQKTKDEHAALTGVVGGMSHTFADHEERLRALEGE